MTNVTNIIPCAWWQVKCALGIIHVQRSFERITYSNRHNMQVVKLSIEFHVCALTEITYNAGKYSLGKREAVDGTDPADHRFEGS